MGTIDDTADALLAVLRGVTDFTTVWKWSPADLGPLPAAQIEPPKILRTGIEERESELGANDWTLQFPFTAFVELTVAEAAQTLIVGLIDQVVAAIDDNPGLGLSGEIEAKVTSAELLLIQEKDRVLLAYEATIEVLRLVVPTY